ncbi:MAG: TIGR03435 family protein [Acidobacteriaceae bacterium]
MPTLFVCLFLAFRLATFTTSFARSQQVAAKPEPAFETVSVRTSHLTPGCFSMLPPGGTQYAVTCLPLRILIAMAWRVNPDNIQGGDAHALDTLYDIRAATPEGKPWTNDTIPPMLRQMLRERFHVAVHSGTKEVSGYSLVVAKGGPKLKPTDINTSQLGQKAGEPSQNFVAPGYIQGRGINLFGIAGLLSSPAHATVVDHTGISGMFNIDLRFAPENSSNSDQPNFFTAVEEQLGLELRPEKVTVNTLVVDHADSNPTPN